jgi:hypothetical protein
MGLWKTISTAATVYVVVQKLKALNSMRADIYEELSPEMQARYREFFGDPKMQIPDPFAIMAKAALPYVDEYVPDSWEAYVKEVLVVSPQGATEIVQVRAGA